MITDALLGMLNILLGTVIVLLPPWSWTLPDEIRQFLVSMVAFDDVLPITEVFAVTATLLTFVSVVVAVKWLIKVVDWIADVIP